MRSSSLGLLTGDPTLTSTTPPGREPLAPRLEELTASRGGTARTAAGKRRRRRRPSGPLERRAGTCVRPRYASPGGRVPRRSNQLPSHLAQRTVKLDARQTPRPREVVRVGARRRAGRVAEDRHTERGAAARRSERQHEQELVPVVAGQVRVRPLERVHGLALVELERARAVERPRTTRAYWYSVSVSWMTRAPASVSPFTVPSGRTSRIGEHARVPSSRRLLRQPPHGDASTSTRPKRMNVRRVPMSGMNSSAEVNVPSSEPTVEIAYRRPEIVPASRDVADREAQRVRRDRAGDEHGRGDEHRDAEQRPDEGAGGDRVQRVHGRRRGRDRRRTAPPPAAGRRAARSGTGPRAWGCGRRAGRRTSSRSRAPRGRSRSCWPRRSWRRRSTARAAARRRSRRRGCSCRRRRRSGPAVARGGGACACERIRRGRRVGPVRGRAGGLARGRSVGTRVGRRAGWSVRGVSNRARGAIPIRHTAWVCGTNLLATLAPTR